MCSTGPTRVDGGVTVDVASSGIAAPNISVIAVVARRGDLVALPTDDWASAR